MNDSTTFLKVKDHSVSGEEFQLIQNKTYGFLETSPQPEAKQLSDYYKTEDYISHTDSKRNLFEKVYHLVRSISLKKKLKLINSFQSLEKNLLDVGCGTGDFLQVAQQNNWNISGIEPNEQARQIANRKTNNSVFNINDLGKFKNHSFDVITLWHVLEHLPNLEQQVLTLKTLLKENGTLIVAVPNHKSNDAKHYKNFWAAYDVPRHLWHFNQDSISKLFALQNMQVVKTKPMKFDAYYVSLLSEKYKSGSMNLFKAFWIGLRSNMKAKRSGEYSSLIYIIKNT
jgi:2-polyprenyl-3-methyl-5-hydroxy-6-metoxy-1,4-benzoquinol methylase